MDAMMDLDAEMPVPSASMQISDFEAYGERLHGLGMPRWTAEQTAGLDHWLVKKLLHDSLRVLYA